jgi:GT2 family glycosyltransferase
MTTSIVVPIYALQKVTLDAAIEALRQIKANTPEDHELIVVDNGGLVSGKRMASVADTYLRLDPNQGFSGGVNAGLRVATGATIAVGSADVFVPPGWLPRLLAAAVGMNGIATPHEKGRQEIGKLARRRGGFWGVIWVMPRAVLDAVGYLDETELRYRIGDQDFAIRAAKAGFWVGRVQAVEVEHRDPHSTLRLTAADVVDAEKATMRRRYGATTYGLWRHRGGR